MNAIRCDQYEKKTKQKNITNKQTNNNSKRFYEQKRKWINRTRKNWFSTKGLDFG